MADVTIKNEAIIKCLNENIEEILKDVLTGWDSPVKKLMADEEGSVYKALKKVTEDTFKSIINSPDFKEELKEQMMNVAIENMMKRD